MLAGALALASGAATQERRQAYAPAPAYAPPADYGADKVMNYDVEHKQCNQKICGTYAEECKTYCAAYETKCSRECIDYKKSYYVERTGVNKQAVQTCAQYETRRYKECVEFEKMSVNVCAGYFKKTVQSCKAWEQGLVAICQEWEADCHDECQEYEHQEVCGGECRGA